MKTMNLLKRSFFALAAMGVLLTACKDDEKDDVKPEPTADFTFSPAAPEAGQEVSFTTTSENATTYAWSFGNGQTSTEKDPKTTYANGGNFNVILIATGEGGSVTVSKQVTVTVPVPQAEPIEIYFLDNTGDVFTLKKMDNIGVSTRVTTAFTTTGYAIGLAFDPASSTVYYSDDDNGTIVKVGLNGSGSTNIVTGISSARGLALNSDGTVLYVVDRGINEIMSVQLSSNAKTVLVAGESFEAITGVFNARPEGIAHHNGKLYFNCVGIDAEAIWSVNVDGTELTQLLTYDDAGYGYSIAVDAANSKLYFDDFDGKKIWSSSLTGTSVTEIADTDNRAFGLTIDPVDSKIYWNTAGGFLKRANLDGTAVETLGSDLGTIRGIFVRRTN